MKRKARANAAGRKQQNTLNKELMPRRSGEISIKSKELMLGMGNVCDVPVWNRRVSECCAGGFSLLLSHSANNGARSNKSCLSYIGRGDCGEPI